MSESQLIKYKESWCDEYLKWICGFANAQGGVVYIGKRDDGSVCGVADSKKLMEDIPNKVPFSHHIAIFSKVKNLQERYYYIHRVVESSARFG